MSNAYTVNIQANTAEIERMARESVEQHLANVTKYQLSVLISQQLESYISKQVQIALTLPEVAEVINSTVMKRAQAEIDRKIAKLQKKLGGGP